MSDQTAERTHVDTTTETVGTDSAAEAVTPEAPQVAAPEASTVGDENLPDAREPEVHVTQGTQDAQVTGGPAQVVEQVPVHEVFVTTDTVILDTSDPLAVQIPDAGRGDASLPIHALSGPTPEQVFASEADKDNDA